jgi:hypothetical protein
MFKAVDSPNLSCGKEMAILFDTDAKTRRGSSLRSADSKSRFKKALDSIGVRENATRLQRECVGFIVLVGRCWKAFNAADKVQLTSKKGSVVMMAIFVATSGIIINVLTVVLMNHKYQTGVQTG